MAGDLESQTKIFRLGLKGGGDPSVPQLSAGPAHSQACSPPSLPNTISRLLQKESSAELLTSLENLRGASRWILSAGTSIHLPH